MLADSGWVETIRDKNYAASPSSAASAAAAARGNKDNNNINNNNNNNKSEFMNKTREVNSEQQLGKEFRQMNIGDSSSSNSGGGNSSSGSDLLMGEKITQSGNFKLQQNVNRTFFCLLQNFEE